MLDIDDLLELLWKMLRILYVFLRLVFFYCSPARLIRKAISRTNFMDYGRPFHIQIFRAFIDFLSWWILAYLIVKLLEKQV